MPDININISPTGETKLADDNFDIKLNKGNDYPFMDTADTDTNKFDTADSGMMDAVPQNLMDTKPVLPVDNDSPEKKAFKQFLTSLREGLKSSLDAEAVYKKLSLASKFPDGNVGSGVYMLNVAEIRDRLQKTTSLLSDIFNAFGSIGREQPEAEPTSGFFTDRGFKSSSETADRDSLGEFFTDEDQGDIEF